MPSPKPKEYTIGALATAAGVNVETIRYYQRIGLLKEPVRPAQGFRQYPQETLDQILFIRRAQQLGFSLQDVAELLELGEGHCRDVRLRVEQKRDKINRQIRDLQALNKILSGLIAACQHGEGNQSCPIVEALLAHNENG